MQGATFGSVPGAWAAASPGTPGDYAPACPVAMCIPSSQGYYFVDATFGMPNYGPAACFMPAMGCYPAENHAYFAAQASPFAPAQGVGWSAGQLPSQKWEAARPAAEWSNSSAPTAATGEPGPRWADITDQDEMPVAASFVPRNNFTGRRRQRRGMMCTDQDDSMLHGAALPEELAEMRRAVEDVRRTYDSMQGSDKATFLPKACLQHSLCNASTTDSLPQLDEASDLPEQLWAATPDSTPPRSRVSWNSVDFGFTSDQVDTHFAPTAGNSAFNIVSTTETGGGGTDDIMAQLATGDLDSRKVILEWVIANLWSLSSTPGGCRIVQKALDVADAPSQVAMAEQLHGHVLEAAASPHANHVLQKCISTLPTDQINFVLEELAGNTAVVARHRYGCRVLQRLIEHFPLSRVEHIVEEVLEAVEKLCRHAFGNFVIQHIMEHGSDTHRQHVANVLCIDAVRLAKHRVASHVVKAALLHCNQADNARVVQALTADASELSNLAHHHCGSFVVRELRRTNDIRR